jgi:hypothetical protein
MTMNAMTALWARTALVWFLATILFGMTMGMTQQFAYAPAHAHMGVLGWLSSAVFAVIYAVARPMADGARAPMMHWIAHNLGVVIMAFGLFMLINSGGAWEALIPVGATMVIVAGIWLTIMMWSRLSASAKA